MTPKTIDLALQGGGAHGAFTWGVLDRLLDDERLLIKGISGTSAGAMNAVVLADGYLEGGRLGAQKALWAFWKRISRAADISPLKRSPFDLFFGGWDVSHSPAYLFFDWFSRLVSPYQFNPLDFNPIRQVMQESVDFARVRKSRRIRLFVAATNVYSGKVRVFRNAELTPDALTASACLPILYQSVKLEGQPYWDGGYVANPAILPLIAESEPSDLIIVQINTSRTDRIPTTSREILDRINEVTFNNSMVKEMRAVTLLKQLIREEHASGTAFSQPLFQQVDRLHVHRIEALQEMSELDVSSKLNPEWRFLIHLHQIGRRTADAWLEQNFDALTARSTVDLVEAFL